MKFKNIYNAMIECPCAFEDIYVGDMFYYKGAYLMKINEIHINDGYCNFVCIGIHNKLFNKKIIGKLGWLSKCEYVGRINREFIPN